MVYKQKLIALSSIVAALALIYVLTVVFEPERIGSRSAAYTWLEPKEAGRIDRVAISAAGGGTAGETTELARKNGVWVVPYNGRDYPARQLRVDDFIGVLTKRAPYPAQTASPAAHERLGLTTAAASRVTVSGGAGLPLLDLLIGQPDTTGRNVYLRREGQNEVRSGENVFSAYVTGPRSSWYNLRLFPESEDGKLDVDGVQRLTVYPAAGAEGAPPEPRVFTRNDREWNLAGMSVADPDTGKIDGYIRGILNTEGEDFSDTAADELSFDDSRMELQLSDGSIKTVRLTAPGEDSRRFAMVSGADYVYILPGWAAGRLFREAASFEKDTPSATPAAMPAAD